MKKTKVRCVEVSGGSPASDHAACAEVLEDVARDRGLSLSRSQAGATLKRLLKRDSTARILLLVDESGWPAALCLFHVLTELEGDRLWVSEFYIRYDDHERELEASRLLAARLTEWAKAHGCASMAGAAEKEDIEMRELARILRMDSERMVLLSRGL